MRGPVLQRRLCTFFLLPVLWLAVSGFQSGQPAKPQGSETQVPEAGSKPAAKPAWKWTLEERLAARFDPEAVLSRQAEYQAYKDALRKRFPEYVKRTAAPAGLVEEMLDGSKNPELFLPGELFDILLQRAFAPGRESANVSGFRADYQRWAAALGLGADLWDRLEEASAPYLSFLQSESRQGLPSSADIPAKEARSQFRTCQARIQALEEAKVEFGEEVFLRLLYEAVAPSVREASLYPSNHQRMVDELRFQEGGCR